MGKFPKLIAAVEKAIEMHGSQAKFAKHCGITSMTITRLIKQEAKSEERNFYAIIEGLNLKKSVNNELIKEYEKIPSPRYAAQKKFGYLLHRQKQFRKINSKFKVSVKWEHKNKLKEDSNLSVRIKSKDGYEIILQWITVGKKGNLKIFLKRIANQSDEITWKELNNFLLSKGIDSLVFPKFIVKELYESCPHKLEFEGVKYIAMPNESFGLYFEILAKVATSKSFNNNLKEEAKEATLRALGEQRLLVAVYSLECYLLEGTNRMLEQVHQMLMQDLY